MPSPADGVLKEIKFANGATVTSQQVLAVIEEGAARGRDAEAPKRAKADSAPAPAGRSRKPRPRQAAAAAPAAPTPAAGGGELPPRRALHRRRRKDRSGAGRRHRPRRRVTKEDLVNYASGKTAGRRRGGARPEERVPMTRMRASIAERLMQSKNSIAMLTSFNEINLAKVMAMRKELGEQFEKANGIKLGFMSFFAKAAAKR